MRKPIISICAALAVLVAVPATAFAHGHRHLHIGSKIVAFKSIGGISLGITPTELRHRLGRPRHVKRLDGQIAEMSYGHGTILNPGLAVYFDTLDPRRRADEIEGYEPRMQTPNGIHPGSSLRALRRAYRHTGLHKLSEGVYGIIHGKEFHNGEHEMDFWVLDGRVYEIEVQTMFDDLGPLAAPARFPLNACSCRHS